MFYARTLYMSTALIGQWLFVNFKKSLLMKTTILVKKFYSMCRSVRSLKTSSSNTILSQIAFFKH